MFGLYFQNKISFWAYFNNVLKSFVTQTQIINKVYMYIQDPLQHFNKELTSYYECSKRGGEIVAMSD